MRVALLGTIATPVSGEEFEGVDLTLSAPATGYVDEPVFIDAYPSTGVSDSPQADGSPSVTVDFGDGFTSNILRNGHAYLSPDTFTITVNGKNADGDSGTEVSEEITISDVPAATGGGIQNLTDSGNAATNATNLQSAIDTAAAANSVEQEIRLNGTWSTVINGPIVLTRPTGGSKYITIKWTGLSVARNTRVGVSDMTNAPRINAPSATSSSTAAMWTPNPAAANPSHHYRIIGLKFAKNSSDQSSYLVSLGDHNIGQNAYSMQPTYFLIDRCLFDGGTGVSNLGLRIAADYVTVKDSYFTNFKVETGIDACAIAISKGKGPWAIWNNYLEASSENFFIGGADAPLESWTGTISNPTTTSATLSSVTGLEVDANIVLPVGGATTYGVQYSTIVRSISGNNITFDAISSAPFNTGTAKWAITPSFLEFRRNWLFKPLTWRVDDPSYAGTHWQIKNLWETKALRYAVMDGNVFQNSWVDAQAFAIALSPRKTNGFEHEAAVIREIQFSNNVFWNLANGVSIPAYDDQVGTNPVQLTRDITFRNNLFWNVGEDWDATDGPYRQFFSFTSTTSPVRAQGVHFVHNTFDAGSYTGTGMAVTVFGSNDDGSGVTEGLFLNNTFPGLAGFFSSSSTSPAVNIPEFMAPGTTNWDKNYVVNVNSLTYPAGAIIEFLTWTTQVFTDHANGDFTLAAGADGNNAGLDGLDTGIIEATLRAVIGASSAAYGTASIKAITGAW